MAQQFLLGSSDLDTAALARVGDKDSIDSYAELIEVVREHCGAEVAALFAEPVRGFNRNTRTGNVTWFCAYEGTPYPFNKLDAAALRPVADLLRARLKSFSELLADPRYGPRLGAWLHVMGPGDILSVGGQPVIKNWGMVPAEIAASEEAREAHFRRTTEPYAPRIPLPPFNGEEAQSFVQRLGQLAARDNSVAARATMAGGAPPPPRAEPPPPPIVPLAAPAVAGRPWLAPLIATGVAVVVLALIELLHLLVYPVQPVAPGTADLDTQRAANDALARRLHELEDLSAKVCRIAPGTTTPANGADLWKALPQPPEKVAATPAEPPGQPPKPVPLSVLLNGATVLVATKNGSGSGFFISDHNIVTNHHVAENFQTVKVGNKALGGFVEARVVAVGAGRARGTQDIAVLEIDPKPGVQALRLAPAPAQLARVTAAGFPGAVLETMRLSPGDPLPEANLTQGIVTSHQKQQPAGVETIIHTATIGHGNSGGPLVDEGGCAVGVNSWLAFDASGAQVFQTFDQALDASELRKFLDDKGIKYTAAAAPCEATPTPAPSPTPTPTGSPAPTPTPSPSHS